MTQDEYSQLKKQYDSILRQEIRIEGQLEELSKKISSEFGCKNEEELKALLEELQDEFDVAEKKFEQEVTTFNIKWKGKV